MARLIAIDLGAHAVKLSVLQGTGRDHELEEDIIRLVPQDGTEVPPMSDRLATLDMLLREHPELAESHIVEVAWSGDRAAVHRLELPFSDEEQIKQTLPFAVEQEVPFDLEDMLLGWRKVGPTQVLAALAREEDVGELCDLLGARGLDPRRVLVDGDVLAAYGGFHDAVSAVVDVGHAHTTVTIAQSGDAQLFRSINVAGRMFTAVIQGALGCTWGEAERIKHAAGDESAAPAPVEDPEATDPAMKGLPAEARTALDGALGLLLAEIRTTLVDAEDRLGIEIDEVVLTGGGSRVPSLRSYLAEDLGLPVRDPESPDHGHLPPQLALVRALAHDMTSESTGHRIDLRVGDLEYRGGMDLTRAVLTYGGAGLGCFLLAVFVMFGWNLYTLQSELSDVDARIAAVLEAAVGVGPGSMTSGGIVSMMADMVGEAQDEAEFLGDGGAVPETVDLLYRITKAFPAHPDVTVNVDVLEIKPKAVTINGVTEGFTQVDRIGQGLQAAGLFRSVNAEPGNRDSKGKLNFTVTIDRSSEEDDTDVLFDEEG